MKNNGKCLLCCASYKEWLDLKELCKSDYIVATSDYSFYKEIRDCEEQIVFWESNEQAPREAAWEVLDEINNLIDKSEKCEYSRLFYFPYQVSEIFPFRVIRIIININILDNIIKKYDISEVYLFDNKENWVMNESIYLYAQSRAIACHIFDIEKREPKLHLKTLETMGMKTDDMCEGNIFSTEKKKLDEIKMKPEKAFLSNEVRDEEIGILYCASHPCVRTVDWTLKRIEAIGGKVKVICYYNIDDVKKFKDRGLETDCLEDYFCAEDFFSDYKKLRKKRKEILHILEEQLQVSYLGIDLSAYLTVKIRNFYYRELIDYAYMNVCAKKYFSNNTFQYINIWGNTNYWETWVCYDNTRNRNTKLFDIRMTTLIKGKEKQPYQNMLSAVFAPNKYAVCDAFTDEYLGKICFICDAILKDDCKKIGCLNHDKKSIGIFPSGIVTGFTTYSFYYNTFMPLIDKLLNKEFKIIFKYHPGYNDCWEEDVKQQFMDNEQFVFFDSDEGINGAMEQCDVVITDISNVVFDTAIEQKVAFCIVEDQSYNAISQNEKGFFIYKNVDDIIKNIELVLNNEDMYRKTVKRQNRYMLELTGNNGVDDYGLIREVLHSIM